MIEDSCDTGKKPKCVLQMKHEKYEHSDYDSDEDEKEGLFETFLVERCVGNKYTMRSAASGDKKSLNKKKNGQVVRCFDCNPDKHLAWYLECPKRGEQ